MPGVAIFLKAGHASLAGGKDFHRGDGAEYFDRQHVPDIVGNDVPDDEIYFPGRVDPARDVAARVKGVSFLALVCADFTCTRQQ